MALVQHVDAALDARQRLDALALEANQDPGGVLVRAATHLAGLLLGGIDDLGGSLLRGTYELAYRPQPLPIDDELTVEVTTTGGDTVLRHSGPLGRRTLLTADRVEAWR